MPPFSARRSCTPLYSSRQSSKLTVYGADVLSTYTDGTDLAVKIRVAELYGVVDHAVSNLELVLFNDLSLADGRLGIVFREVNESDHV